MIIKDFGIVTPEEGLEIEERLFSAGGDSLSIYTRCVPTVSLGRFSDPKGCIDEDYAKRESIHVIRRMSGGSPIYSDRDQLIFTVITGRDRFPSKTDSYEVLCNCLVKTLAHLGIDATYKPVNDILVDGMKISGCAQYRDRDKLLHHGTLILRLDSERMDKVLRPVKERKYPGLTSVEGSLGYVPEREEILKAFEKGFEDLR